MNILITGHSGFIGGATAKYFTEEGRRVYGVSRSLAPDQGYRQYCMDITDCHSLSNLMNEKCIDVVIHFAGKPLVADCDIAPFDAIKSNGLGTAAVLEAARFAKVTKSIIIETDKVYGYQEIVPTPETAVFNPGSPYEFSKVVAANVCDFYRKQYREMDIISVRPVNVFGPGDYSFTRIVPAAIRNIKEGKGVPIQEHAINIARDFIYVKDVAKMMYLLATKDTKHSVYNFSTNQSMSIGTLAQRITKALKHNVEPILVKKPGNYPEIPFQSIDGSRFIEEFDFKFTPFEEAIKETYDES